MKKILILLTLSIFLCMEAHANNTLPTPILNHSSGITSGNKVIPGLQIQFNGYYSYDLDGGYITTFTWFIDGQQVGTGHQHQFNYTFDLAEGETSRVVTLTMRVTDDEGSTADETIAITVTNEGQTQYYITDHLGSIRTTIDNTGRVLGYDDYYPFGLAMPGRSGNSGTPNDLNKFTGHERDKEGGLDLDYMRARNFDPEIGRFMSVDALYQKFPSMSPYNYTMNNPLNMIDPDGNAPCLNGGPCDFEYVTRFLFQEYDNTYVGDLFRADAQGQLEQKVSQDLKDAGNATVDAVAESADNVSDASSVLAVGGIVAAPFTGGSSLAVTGYALGAGLAADATSTAAKTIDAIAFDGTTEAAVDQAIELGVNFATGRVANKVAGSFVRVNSAGRFFNPSSGQFVRNNFGFGVTAASDATQVAIPFVTSKALDKVGN